MIWTLVFAIAVLYWVAPQFFDFLRDVMGVERQGSEELEERVSRLEIELQALRQTVGQGEKTSGGMTLSDSPTIRTTSDAKKQISRPSLRAHLQKALSYKNQTEDLIQSTQDKATKERLQDLVDQITAWVGTFEDLAHRVEAVKQNTLLQQDMKMVPQAIERLAEQIEKEHDADVKAALERALQNRKTQLGTLERLQRLVDRADIQMENTLASLGTIYSQILTAQSTNQVADYRHLSHEAEEERQALQDHLEALTEVKLQAV
ncbi:MAG: hypothetical protein AAF629_32555 [Chloroflexota bacterium]